MQGVRSGLVDIIRDFLVVHASAAEFIRRHRAGDLRFEDVEGWVGEDGRSELFRLKERCHAIFRPASSDAGLQSRAGALLDLSVGSLFHEAMKLRENLYQQQQYAPRVESLRREGDEESLELFSEFEKILTTSAMRLEESVAEVEVMLEQSRKQLHRLILHRGDSGMVARCLYEARSELAEVYPQGLDELYREIHGDTVTGYAKAGDSYLESAYYAEAVGVLTEAHARAPHRKDVKAAIDYAEGMQAFFSRDYERSVARLADWLEAGPGVGEEGRIRLALAGTGHVEGLPEGEEGADVIRQAAEISEELRALQRKAQPE